MNLWSNRAHNLGVWHMSVVGMSVISCSSAIHTSSSNSNRVFSVTLMQSLHIPMLLISILHLWIKCCKFSIVWMFLSPLTMTKLYPVTSAMIHCNNRSDTHGYLFRRKFVEYLMKVESCGTGNRS